MSPVRENLDDAMNWALRVALDGVGNHLVLEGWCAFSRSQSLLLCCRQNYCYPDRISYQSPWLKDMMGDVEKWVTPCSQWSDKWRYLHQCFTHRKWKSLSLAQLLATPWTAACQASLWDFPGKNTGVGCHFLLQGSFPTQGLNLGLLHHRQILYWLNYQGKPQTHSPEHIEDTHKYYIIKESTARSQKIWGTKIRVKSVARVSSDLVVLFWICTLVSCL